MRFVPIKSDDQLDLQSLHRVRERWVMRRTAVVNQIRGLLLERGITLRKGRRYVDAALPRILAEGTSKLSGAVLLLLTALKLELEQLAEKIDWSDASIMQIARENEASTAGRDAGGRSRDSHCDHRNDWQRSCVLQRTRFRCVVGGDPGGALNRRQANTLEDSSARKPVPAQAVRSGRIAVMQHRTKQSFGLSAWLAQLTARTHHNIAIVALANKLARMAWAVLAKNEPYRPPLVAGAATM